MHIDQHVAIDADAAGKMRRELLAKSVLVELAMLASKK